MPTSVTMPQLGESVTEGTVTRWLKNVGDQVALDEPLLEVSTDKVDTEIPAPAAGVLTSISAGGRRRRRRRGAGRHRRQRGRPRRAGGCCPRRPGPAAPEPAAPPAPAAPAAAPVAAAPAPAAPAPPAPAPSAPAASGAETIVTLPALGESVTEGTVTRWLKTSATRSPSTSRCSRCPPTRSTPRSPPPQPACSPGSPSRRTASRRSEPSSGPSASREPLPPPLPHQRPPHRHPHPPPRRHRPQPRRLRPLSPLRLHRHPHRPPPLPPQRPTAAHGAYLTPIVRKLAAERGVDLSTLRGTGVGGPIPKQDVLAAAGGAAPAAPAAPARPPRLPPPLQRPPWPRHPPPLQHRLLPHPPWRGPPRRSRRAGHRQRTGRSSADSPA